MIKKHRSGGFGPPSPPHTLHRPLLSKKLKDISGAGVLNSIIKKIARGGEAPTHTPPAHPKQNEHKDNSGAHALNFNDSKKLSGGFAPLPPSPPHPPSGPGRAARM